MKRSKQLTPATIDCPMHGTQLTYDLFKEDEIIGIGCRKCFEKLEVKEDI